MHYTLAMILICQSEKNVNPCTQNAQFYLQTLTVFGFAPPRRMEVFSCIILESTEIFHFGI